jgi:hypothetical protein
MIGGMASFPMRRWLAVLRRSLLSATTSSTSPLVERRDFGRSRIAAKARRCFLPELVGDLGFGGRDIVMSEGV